MKRVCLPGLAGLLGLMLLAGTGLSADQPATTKNADTKTTDTKNTAKTKQHTANKPVASQGAKTSGMHVGQGTQAARTHLPAGFGKLNMSHEQHQKALAVMDHYASQIKQLESQIHELKAKRDGELNALLDETQKKSLAEVKTTVQKMRAARTANGRKARVVTAQDQLNGLRAEALKNLENAKLPPVKTVEKSAKQGKSSKEEAKQPSQDKKEKDKNQEKK